ncbi:MAG: SDR family oxidoreductase [Puniceicoccales bacterium]
MSILNQFKLEGQVALVTGCKRGIGLAMAKALAEAGADVIGVSASLEPNGSEVETEVRSAGRRFYGYTCDLADPDSLRGFIAKVQREHPVVDILVNNAGTIRRSPAAEHGDEDWSQVLAVNLDAPFVLSREFGKGMLERGRGKIIFTASLLSFQGGILVPGYAASKGAVVQLTMAFSNEWSGRGVCVNAIAPGYIATDNTQALRGDAARSESILSRIPAGRWGNPDDLKGATVFLASSASDYVTGTVLTVDGGWMGR